MPRLIRDDVLPGSMAYSAVSQPIDFPSRNGGTVSDRLAVTRTAVSPQRYSTLPGLLRTNPRSMRDRAKLVVGATERSGHGDLILTCIAETAGRLMRIAAHQEPDQKCHLKMKPVGCLGNDLAARAVEHVRGHLFAAMGGKAVEEDRIGLGAAPSSRG